MGGAEGFSRPVAIKKIHAANPAYRSSLIREAKILSHLHHPNLVGVISLEQEEEELLLILEWVRGIDAKKFLLFLRGQLKGVKGLSRVKFLYPAVFILHEVLTALSYCHHQKPAIIHGDVTPQNILLSQDGQIKLTDFGVARWKNDQNDFSQPLFGNPRYLAPELKKGEQPTIHSDIFQIGIILEEIIHVFSHVAWVSELKPLAKRALKENPKKRFLNAQEFRKAINQIMDKRELAWRYCAQLELKKWFSSLGNDTAEITRETTQALLLKKTISAWPVKEKMNRLICLGFGWLVFFLILFYPFSLPLEENQTTIPLYGEKSKIINSPKKGRENHEIKKIRESPSKSRLLWGEVEIQARPWAHVYLNTVPIGITPQTIRLKPGAYQLEYQYPPASVPKKKHLLVKAGARVRSYVEFEP